MARNRIRSEQAPGNFKACTLCGHAWEKRKDLLEDPGVRVVGYMSNFEELELGLFLFNHTGCGTTFGIHAKEFVDLYEGDVFEQRLTNSDACPAYCGNKEELMPCPAKCECAYVRDVLHRIANWEKF